MSIGQDRSMAKTRALITDREREQLAGEHGDERRWQAVTRIRNRIKGPLAADIESLSDNHEGLLEELRDVVCEDSSDD